MHATDKILERISTVILKDFEYLICRHLGHKIMSGRGPNALFLLLKKGMQARPRNLREISAMKICVRPCQIPFGARGLQLNEMKRQLFTVTHYVANVHIFYDRVGLKCVIFTAVV